jgi:type I restriction enzyme S subunit
VSEIPKGWAKLPLDEATKLIRGISYKKIEASSTPMENYLPILRANNIQNGKLVYQDYVYVPDDKIKEEQYIKANDIVIAMSSGSKNLVGKSGISKSDFDGSFGTFCGLLRPNKELDSRFVGWFTRSQYYSEKVSTLSKGVNINNLKPSHFSEIHIPIAPLNEQTRIADKLDSMLAKVDAAQARLDKIPNILKRFRQSVLAAATSGELTKDWMTGSNEYFCEIDSDIKADKKLSKLPVVTAQELELTKSLFGETNWSRWKTYPLELLVDSIRGIPYGIVQTGEAQDIGVPTIRCGDVKPLKVIMNALKKVTFEIEKKYVRTRLKGGEVLLAIRGTVGHAAVATQELVDLKANISREVAMIPVRDNIDSSYIAMLLQSPGGYTCLAEKVRGVAQKGINLADVKRFVTPLPSLAEQKEIVRRVESLLTMADTVEKQYTDAKARTNRLTQSILAKAFRGELVKQDKNDEPAEELLTRILSEKENKLSVKPARKSVTKNKKINSSRDKIRVGNSVDETSLIKWIKNLEKDTFRNEDLNEAFGSDYEQLKEILFSLLKEDKPMITKVFDVAKKDFMFKKV